MKAVVAAFIKEKTLPSRGLLLKTATVSTADSGVAPELRMLGYYNVYPVHCIGPQLRGTTGHCPVMTGAGGRGWGTTVSSRRQGELDYRGYDSEIYSQ